MNAEVKAIVFQFIVHTSSFRQGVFKVEINSREAINRILEECRTIAVAGLSSKRTISFTN
jgi:hypothetical protein